MRLRQTLLKWCSVGRKLVHKISRFCQIWCLHNWRLKCSAFRTLCRFLSHCMNLNFACWNHCHLSCLVGKAEDKTQGMFVKKPLESFDLYSVLFVPRMWIWRESRSCLLAFICELLDAQKSKVEWKSPDFSSQSFCFQKNDLRFLERLKSFWKLVFSFVVLADALWAMLFLETGGNAAYFDENPFLFRRDSEEKKKKKIQTPVKTNRVFFHVGFYFWFPLSARCVVRFFVSQGWISVNRSFFQAPKRYVRDRLLSVAEGGLGYGCGSGSWVWSIQVRKDQVASLTKTYCVTLPSSSLLWKTNWFISTFLLWSHGVT